jgi:hypothetical protein
MVDRRGKGRGSIVPVEYDSSSSDDEIDAATPSAARTKSGKRRQKGAKRKDSAAAAVRGLVRRRSNFISVLHKYDAKKFGRWLLNPVENKRRAWDLITALLVLYLCVTVPLTLGVTWWVSGPGMKAWGYVVDAWFLIDIILNFRTGFVENGIVIMDPHRIRVHYFRLWFWIDIVGSVPLEYFIATVPDVSLKDAGTSRKAVKLLKYVKLAKVRNRFVAVCVWGVGGVGGGEGGGGGG